MVLIYVCAQHVLKAWQVCALKKIKDVVVHPTILDDLYVILYGMIDLGKNIKDFKAHGKEKVMASLNNISQEMFGHDIFGHINPSLGPFIVKGAMGTEVGFLTKNCILFVSYMDQFIKYQNYILNVIFRTKYQYCDQT